MSSKGNPFRRLLYSSKFWLAVVGAVQTIVFELVPGFPREVWASIDALIAVVIACIAAEDFSSKWGTRP